MGAIWCLECKPCRQHHNEKPGDQRVFPSTFLKQHIDLIKNVIESQRHVDERLRHSFCLCTRENCIYMHEPYKTYLKNGPMLHSHRLAPVKRKASDVEPESSEEVPAAKRARVRADEDAHATSRDISPTTPVQHKVREDLRASSKDVSPPAPVKDIGEKAPRRPELQPKSRKKALPQPETERVAQPFGASSSSTMTSPSGSIEAPAASVSSSVQSSHTMTRPGSSQQMTSKVSSSNSPPKSRYSKAHGGLSRPMGFTILVASSTPTPSILVSKSTNIPNPTPSKTQGHDPNASRPAKAIEDRKVAIQGYIAGLEAQIVRNDKIFRAHDDPAYRTNNRIPSQANAMEALQKNEQLMRKLRNANSDCAALLAEGSSTEESMFAD